ncbi:glyoxylase-like metal-dependent hydrolase (beta-lactamase superfamily II) [Pontibacter ummariensis]|uniref:Glyoxylase, beta-lactamase superfamily II n=1 Tax=Pontibacter ummariensis TaxID=1610492 RepID=A0A239KVC6_9BACT|nr:MBL fold metallo-hydrolase [Pontibacter ummariensis]PRY05033.1 glyoxylase-like metal-dependent hydrolase (beta-lactamase superfamily II) [Pontibacter ummariensis]SNT21459.1 Glyoxylase, beta-lactamase superfamily II [Pontibacter ummariensis]
MERRNFLANLAGLGILSLVKPFSVFSKTVAVSGDYTIEQFEDMGLAHFSYAVIADGKMMVIDPQRDPQIYYDYAQKNNAKIVGVIETHPHADFVSSHLEIYKKLKVPIYSSSLTKPNYPATAFDDGDIIKLSDKIGFRSMHTPGHAPDHISAVLFGIGKDIAVFTGDSLLFGDVGRPDLRDFSNNIETQRQRLAEMMYDTIHGKFAKLKDDVLVYPAHGAGSLCGRSIRKASSSTIGYEKQHNYAFEKRTKAEFVSLLLSDQPFIPQYFSYDVKLNIKGAPDVKFSISKIKRLPKNYQPDAKALIIDSRPASAFKASYLPNAINIQGGGAFETWLGSIVAPDAAFYLVAGDEEGLETAIRRAASIGYEANIKGAFVYDAKDGKQFAAFDRSTFHPEEDKYTYLDVRTGKEVKEASVFKNSINIPLQELSQRISEVPTGKPVLVNCASGYRSAAASSMLKKLLPAVQVYDLGAAVVDYKNTEAKK